LTGIGGVGIASNASIQFTPNLYGKCLNLVDSPNLGANFDTSNACLGGEDPHDWLERINDRVVRIRSKDISVKHLKSIIG
jgi:sugar phosphate isomerase/epimerase